MHVQQWCASYTALQIGMWIVGLRMRGHEDAMRMGAIESQCWSLLKQ